MTFAVEMLNITKKYPGVIANNNVSLMVKQGEIHGLIGENGAGKSTIMKILYGMDEPDEGFVKLFGEEIKIKSPQMAINLGIGMVHQHFMLMPNLTVLQNIILGRPPKKNFLIDNTAAKERINHIINKYELNVNLDAKISQISVGQKQRVEIIKALYRDAKILILDEPTAVLTPNETDKLMDILRKLKEQGCTIIFITHKLREVMAITDRVTVMRKGMVTGSSDTCDTNTKELSKLMVGREVDLTVKMNEYHPMDQVLKVDKISALDKSGALALRQVSFDVKAGEIVGIAGVEGNGQTELIEVIAGMIKLENGEIILNGKKIKKYSIRRRREMGMSHIPEDRLKVGVSKECTIKDNIILGRYYQKPYCKNGIIDNRKLYQFSEKLCKDFLVKTPDSSYKLNTLSGGNMQKVIFAREVETNPNLLIAAQPTRGVDIGAIEYIHNRIAQLRDEGKAVLLVSAELDEILALSDRIFVMYEGEITAEFKRGDPGLSQIGMYMMGAKRQNRSEV